MEKNAISKGGVSPLIATVLIIGFTVILAVLIINWGTDFFQTVQEDTSKTTETQFVCTNDVKFEVSGAKCVGGDLLVTVKNNADYSIQGFVVRFINFDYGDSERNGVKQVMGETLEAYGTTTLVIDSTDLGDIDTGKVDVFPIVLINNVEYTCSENVESFGDLDSGRRLEGC
ncbi:MAG: archaellin/type IV pilin N-terminal domain-containing protein [Nanoarchaeota archaeon]